MSSSLLEGRIQTRHLAFVRLSDHSSTLYMSKCHNRPLSHTLDKSAQDEANFSFDLRVNHLNFTSPDAKSRLYKINQ